MSNFVVVGGGAAGLEMVTRLASSFAGKSGHTVTLVEPSSHHLWKPRLHEIAAGTFDNELDSVAFRLHAACHGYQYVQARMSGLDRANKTITVSAELSPEQTLKYDYLVIAVGAISNDFKIPGVSDHCLFLDSASQAEKAWEQMKQMLANGGAHRVSIVGAGATGVELGAEWAKVSKQLNRYQNDTQLSITLIEAADRVLPASADCMSEKVLKKLQKQGVNVRLNARVKRAEADRIVTENEVIPADLQIWAAGIRCPDWLANLDGLESNRINQLKVLPTLQTTLDESVFVIGDSAECPQEDGRVVPPRAQAANQAAAHLAKQFKRLVKGKELKPFVFKDGGMVVALGHDYAVGALMNDKVVLRGRYVRRLYDTIFRLHQRVIFGWFRVSALVVLKRVKGLLNPYYKGSWS
ncbi:MULTISPECIES: NAD(P)/FAD-dependent oxidoreductase [Vibrio]|nr:MULTISPECIES: NAD(P)/FAD-dependent oxidoreductase [Vibrio]AGU97873.1 NADH dehydrogenase [Vibrio campbellii ATCC BAA-1116]MBT0120658.1 NAD(P)/FAD-dependent oxidoreductase [Vibrio campbellii]MBT0135589.1 NAD(P)/FAD-dependent oxidoreductase [Vibrio campbellii]MBT0140376.1 NAD(P)/FAD-dependent oxidoreductase [Vibrio campbellii]MBT0144979.1 NAD(P)/FAD-dependent oxidoreductase [Vibrio campbellii]